MHSIPLILCLLKLAEGSAVPVTSPNLFGDTLDDFYGCPVEYDSRASYKAGDTVSLIAHGVTSIWRHIGYCDEIISPSNKPSTFPSTGHITSPFFNGNNSTSASPVITSSSPTHSNKTSGTPTLLTNSTESPTVAITSKRTIMPSTQAYVTSPVQSSSAPTTSNATTDNPVVGFTTSPTSAAIKCTNSPTVVSTENPTTSVTTETDDLVYYPDWNGENLSCLSDGNQPIYMNVDPSYYLSPELSLCCTKVSVLGKNALRRIHKV